MLSLIQEFLEKNFILPIIKFPSIVAIVVSKIDGSLLSLDSTYFTMLLRGTTITRAGGTVSSVDYFDYPLTQWTEEQVRLSFII